MRPQLNTTLLALQNSRNFSCASVCRTGIVNEYVPRVTGGGPFIALPRIEPFGNNEQSQKLQIPPGSSLNSRLDSVIQLSSDFEGVRRNLKTLCGKIWYQEVQSSCSNTLLYSFDLSDSSNFAIVDVRKGEVWKLKDQDNLAAWAGYDLQIEELNSALSIRGHGFILARGSGSIYQMKLEEGQQALVKSDSLIATSGLTKPRNSTEVASSWFGIRFFHHAGAKVRALYKDVLAHLVKGETKNSPGSSEKKSVPPPNRRDHIALKLHQSNSHETIEGPGVIIFQNGV